MEKMAYYPIPQPDEIPVREREDAMGAYLMMFASVAIGFPLPIINLLAAIIYYYVNKSSSRFVHFHALQSLYSQLPTSIINAVLVFWTIRIFLFHHFEVNAQYKGYVAMAIVANIVYVVFSIIAAVKARKGYFYYFLFFGKIAYQHVYAVQSSTPKDTPVNQPPQH
jgi:uncharacterized Tic20 family protein